MAKIKFCWEMKMQIYILYFTVSILAFGIGSFSVNLFYTNYLDVEMQDKSTVEKFSPLYEPVTDNNPKIEFSCNDEVINTVWKRLKRNKIFMEDAYNNVIKPNKIDDCRKLFYVSSINLNSTKPDDFIVMGNQYLFCSSGGNCRTWIVNKDKNRFRIVFESTTGDSISTENLQQDIKPLGSLSHNFKDLKVFIPNGWEADNIGYFKFDGKRYKINKCLVDINSAYDYSNVRDEKLIPVKLNKCLKGNLF